MNREQPGSDVLETLRKVMTWANPFLPGPDPAPYTYGPLPKDGDLVVLETGNGFRYEGIAHIEHRGAETIIRLDETTESLSRRTNVIRGGRAPEWTVHHEPETPQQRALPRPSTEPPMWANNPTRSRRTRNRARGIRTPRI